MKKTPDLLFDNKLYYVVYDDIKTSRIKISLCRRDNITCRYFDGKGAINTSGYFHYCGEDLKAARKAYYTALKRRKQHYSSVQLEIKGKIKELLDTFQKSQFEANEIDNALKRFNEDYADIVKETEEDFEKQKEAILKEIEKLKNVDKACDELQKAFSRTANRFYTTANPSRSSQWASTWYEPRRPSDYLRSMSSNDMYIPYIPASAYSFSSISGAARGVLFATNTVGGGTSARD